MIDMSISAKERWFDCKGIPGPHRVHALIWKSDAPSAHPPVICVHGLTRNGYDFKHIAEHLSKTRDVISLTMPGRGRSDWLSDSAHYTYPNYVQDCLHIIRDELKLAEIDWIGTSMGGLIGMWVGSLDERAEDKPKPLVRKLVLNDIGPYLPLSAVKRIALYAGRKQDFASIEEAERYCRAIYADFGIQANADWRFFAETTVRAKKNGGYELHYDTSIAKVFGDIKEDVSVWPMYERVSCPVLLLRGARSDVLSKEIALEMTQRGPKARLVSFDGCGHAPALINPDQIKTVEEFFDH